MNLDAHRKIQSCPRSHPLTRRNGPVNQVEFLGLAHFATVSLSNVLPQTRSKKVQILKYRDKNFSYCKGRAT